MISVLNDPLFKVERLDGTVYKTGLIELICNAHNIKQICARTPTGKEALFLLTLAYLHEVYVPEDVSARRALFEAGAFDGEHITSYADKYADRFLLDDECFPFMQSAYDPALDSKALRPVAALVADLPSGNAHIHLNHQGQDGHALDACAALEALLETQRFCLAGLMGPSGSNNTPPIHCVVHGRNLFETLVLNMTSRRELNNIPFGEGEAAWALNETVVPRKSYVSMSFIRAMTWQPRRVKLVFDDDGMARSVYLQAGLDFRGNGLWLDPRVPYRKTKDGQLASLKPELGRQLWRDVGMLIASKTLNVRPPVTLLNAGDVWEDCPAVLSVELTGLISHQATCLGWAHEVLSLPKSLLEDADRSDEFREYIGAVEDIRRLLMSETRKAFSQQVALQAGEVFLEAMRTAVFTSLLPSFAVGGRFELSARMRQLRFFDELKNAIEVSVKQVVEKCGTGVNAIMKQNNVSRFTWGYYYKMRKEAGLGE